MPYSETYLYSPLHENSFDETSNRALLLQFILSELIQAQKATHRDDPLDFVFSSPSGFYPYDWSHEVGCLNKLSEHSRLLEHAFPNLEQAQATFQDLLEAILGMILSRKKKKQKVPSTDLSEDLQKLYHHLLPFLFECKENEGLILFLLQNGDEIANLAKPETVSHLLKRMYPEGLSAISPILKREYHQRGFDALLPEIDRLLSMYEH